MSGKFPYLATVALFGKHPQRAFRAIFKLGPVQLVQIQLPVALLSCCAELKILTF